MPLLTNAQKTAARLDEMNEQVASHLEAIGKEAFTLANTPGQEQEIMDALGTQATSALAGFGVLQLASLLFAAIGKGKTDEVLQILQSLAPSLADLKVVSPVPAANLEIFQPQPDGTVAYAPPEQE
jgi:anti-sigma factor RsiW